MFGDARFGVIRCRRSGGDPATSRRGGASAKVEPHWPDAPSLLAPGTRPPAPSASAPPCPAGGCPCHDCIRPSQYHPSSPRRSKRYRAGVPTWWIFNMFVVVRPCGDAATMTTDAPGSAWPCSRSPSSIKEIRPSVSSATVAGNASTPQRRHSDRRTSTGGTKAYTGTSGRSNDRSFAVRPVSV